MLSPFRKACEVCTNLRNQIAVRSHAVSAQQKCRQCHLASCTFFPTTVSMASRRASAVPRTVQLPGQEKKLPKLALYFLTASIDIVCSKVVGVVPAPGVQFIRSAVIFLLYREWVLALVCGFFLPAMVPLTVICCLKRSWAAFRVSKRV